MCCSLDKYECLRHGGKKKLKKKPTFYTAQSWPARIFNDYDCSL